MNLGKLLQKFKDPVFRAKFDSRYGLGRVETFLAGHWFNPLATLWLNFRSFPIRQAVRFPFWVYGRPRFYSLSGTMRMAGKFKSGAVKFNVVKQGAPRTMRVSSEICNRGEIVFEGNCEIGTGNKIITSFGKTLSLGHNLVLTDHISITVTKSVKIGGNTRIASGTLIMDTDYHFIADLNRKQISPRSKPIVIGNGVWISSNCTILKGSVIPDYAIMGSNTVTNSDFGKYTDGCLIVGQPAKVVKVNVCILNNPAIESEVWKHLGKQNGLPFNLDITDREEIVKFD